MYSLFKSFNSSARGRAACWREYLVSEAKRPSTSTFADPSHTILSIGSRDDDIGLVTDSLVTIHSRRHVAKPARLFFKSLAF
jgi:hypothetical protein